MLALQRLAAITYQVSTENLALSPWHVCHSVQFNLNRWSTQGSSDPSAHALFLPASWDFKPFAAYFRMELLTPHRLCISQAKLTYLPPKYYFSCFPHHATGSSSLLTQLHVQKRMPFPLLHTFLSYLYSSLKHLISVLPISLLGILYVLTNGNLISSLIIPPIFCSSPYFYNIHEKPFKIQVPNQLHEFPISVAPANGQVKVLMSSTQFCSWSHFISLVYRLPL